MEFNKDDFLTDLGLLCRRHQVKIDGKFNLKKLPEEECGCMDHGAYRKLPDDKIKWNYSYGR